MFFPGVVLVVVQLGSPLAVVDVVVALGVIEVVAPDVEAVVVAAVQALDDVAAVRAEVGVRDGRVTGVHCRPEVGTSPPWP